MGALKLACKCAESRSSLSPVAAMIGLVAEVDGLMRARCRISSRLQDARFGSFAQAGLLASVLRPLAQPGFSSVFRERGICSACCDGKRSDASGEWLAWLEDLCPTRLLISSCYPARSLGWIVRALSSSLRYDANRDNQRKLTANVGSDRNSQSIPEAELADAHASQRRQTTLVTLEKCPPPTSPRKPRPTSRP